MASKLKESSASRSLLRHSSFETSKKKSQQKTRLPPIKNLKLSVPSPKIKKFKEKHEYDKDLEQKFEKIIDGQLANLPDLPRSIVRIFLSSTFSDMRAERNTVLRDIYPCLKEYCASLDLDFQFVDMRWGVTDDSINDHSSEELCLKEVETCQRVSLGPNFVALTGDRYGYRPIPVEINVKEFEELSAVMSARIEDRDLLLTWYERDDNAIPPVYVLQPIRSQFKFYGNYAPGLEDKRQAARISWQQTFESIQRILRQAADSIFKSGKLTEKQYHHYQFSVTESEIIKGIIEAKSPQDHVLYFHRELIGLSSEIFTETSAKKYIDIINTSGKIYIDEDASRLKEVLDRKVASILPKSRRKHYKPLWTPVTDEHYLNSFQIDFVTGIIDLIDKAIESRQINIRTTNYYSDYLEILHHLKFCKLKCESFCGQSEILQQIKSLILDEGVRQSIFVHGESGSGKTSIMAMVMNNLKKWFSGKEYVGVIRFLGTSPSSLNIYDVLLSVCGQLADAAELIMEPVAYRNMKSLVEYLPRYLRRVASKLKIAVVVLLDSVDQLLPVHDAYLMKWLPTNLPSNVHFIISTLPSQHGILDNIKKRFPTAKLNVAVPSMSEATGKEIIANIFRQKNRCLTTEQMNYLHSISQQTPGPLFLKLLLDEAVKWHSYIPVSHVVLKSSVRSAIDLFFTNLEQKYGPILIRSALGFITVGKSGISEIEMEDALSCDDRVLDEVYQYHDPPVEGIVRIPPVLWARVRHDIGGYLVERLTHSKTTFNWYHRQFIEAASEKYTTGKNSIYLHKVLSEIYLGTNGVRRDIVLSKRKLTIPNADRLVTHQLLTIKNKRKLDCLPYHLIKSFDTIETGALKKYCLCNFEFLRTKISAFSVQAIIDDMQAASEEKEDTEILLLQRHLISTNTDLKSSIKLATHLLAHIQPQEGQTYLVELLNQAKDFLLSQNSPVLIPVYPCLAPRHDKPDAMMYTLDECADIVAQSMDSILTRTLASFQHGSGDIFTLFNISTDEMKQIQLPEIHGAHAPCLGKDGELIIYLTACTVVCQTISTGDETKRELKSLHQDLKADDIYQCVHQGSSYAILCLKQGLVFSLEIPTLNIFQKYDLSTSSIVLHSLICTNGDPLKIVLFTSKKEAAEGVTELYCCYGDPSSTSPRVLTINASPEKGHSALTYMEEILVVTSQAQRSEIIIITISEMMITNRMDIPESVHCVIGSDTLCHVTVLSTLGNVYCVNCQKSEMLCQMTLDSPVTSIGVLLGSTVAIMGDSKGQIIIKSMQEESLDSASIQAHDQSVKMISILGEQLITLGSNNQLKVWSISELKKKIISNVPSEIDENTESNLLDQTSILSINTCLNSNEFITFDKEQHIKVWSVQNAQFLRRFDIEFVPDQIEIISENHSIVFEQLTGKLVLLDTEIWKTNEVLHNIQAFTINKAKDVLYAVTQEQNVLEINKIDVKSFKVRQKFALSKVLHFTGIDATLSATERFLVLKVKIAQKEYKEIEASWKKQGMFLPQCHQYRFTAIDLSQASGGLIHCYRELCKIPFLGEFVSPYRGNIVMIATRDVIAFWDIPTGKCDEKISKSTHIRMMCRNHWVGEGCVGICKCIDQSINQKYIAIGSEDGYVVIYDSECGLPVGRKCPQTRHSAQVTNVRISPDCRWVVSACLNHTLKLWETKMGQEVFSIQVDARVTAIQFTANSKHLVALTGMHGTRLLLFQLHVHSQ